MKTGLIVLGMLLAKQIAIYARKQGVNIFV
jgi:hypothetical protein